jgi:hypothetical protein
MPCTPRRRLSESADSTGVALRLCGSAWSDLIVDLEHRDGDMDLRFGLLHVEVQFLRRLLRIGEATHEHDARARESSARIALRWRACASSYYRTYQ